MKVCPGTTIRRDEGYDALGADSRSIDQGRLATPGKSGRDIVGHVGAGPFGQFFLRATAVMMDCLP